MKGSRTLKLRWLRRRPRVSAERADYFAGDRPDVAEVLVAVRVERPGAEKYGARRVTVKTLSGLVGREEYSPFARWCFGDSAWSWDSEALQWMEEQGVTPVQVEAEIELDCDQLEELYREAQEAALKEDQCARSR